MMSGAQVWEFVRLGDICELLPSKSIASEGDAQVRAITTACLSESGFLPAGVKDARMHRGDVPDCLVTPGEVLVARSNTPELVGRASVYRGEPPGVVATDLTIRMWPRARVMSEFLAGYLSYLFKTGYWRDRAGGASGSMKKITRQQILDERVPIPPLPEQERIAAWLTEQLAAVESARAAAQARLAAAEALPAAYLREVFEGLDGNVPTRLLADISDLASGITLGKRPHASNGREVPYLRVANVQDGHLLLDDVYTIRATEDEIEELKLRPGDLVLTEGGDRDKLGRGTWWNEELPECIHQNHIFRVRLQSDVVDHEFFGFQIQSAYAKNYFLAHAKQTTGIATINRRVLGALPVLLPNLAEQRRIASELTLRLAEAERLTAFLRDELVAIDALPAALLREAFNGQA
jgi:type I restriction enzyme S subunit